MCGILGFVSDNIEHPAEAHRFLGALLEESRRRGRDASGFAAKTEKDFITDKHALSAEDFIRLSKAFRSLRGEDKISLIGHTRAATNGTPSVNSNNHPFHGPRYSIVHNGGIWSFREIAKHHNFELKTNCDSELILHFLESRKDIRNGIIDSFSYLDATSFMAVAALERETGDVHLFRNSSSPCVILKVDRWNATVFASTLDIILDATEQVFGDSRAIWDFASLQHYENKGMSKFDMPSFSHLTIKPDGSIVEVDVIKDVNIDRTFSRRYTSYSYGWSDWDDSDIAAFSGGTSKYENSSSEVESSTQLRCHKCKKFVKKDSYAYTIGGNRHCKKCYQGHVTGRVSTVNSENQWKCIECYNELEHSLGDVKEVGKDYVCDECWDSIDTDTVDKLKSIIVCCANCKKLLITPESASNENRKLICYGCYESEHLKSKGGESLSKITLCLKVPRKSKSIGSTRTTPISDDVVAEFENRLWSCIPAKLREEFGRSGHLCVEALDNIRGVKYDYELSAYDMNSYMIQPTSIEDKVANWEDMTIDSIYQMNDGEYLSYVQFLEELLVDG